MQKNHNLDIADVVRNSVRAFLAKISPAKSIPPSSGKELPAHLKQMRGVLADVSDKEDDKLNYLLEKYK